MELVVKNLEKQSQASKLQALKSLVCNLRGPLGKLNRSKYADIYAQQAKARENLTQDNSTRQTYVSITHSALSLIKQQSKAEWIGFGDECSRYFIAKIRQRKAMTSIFQLKDKHDQWVEGFDAVADTITDFYKRLRQKLSKPSSPFQILNHQDQMGLIVEHLFFTCHKEKEIWRETLRDWGIHLQVEGLEQCVASFKKQKGARQIRGLIKAIVNAVIYHIW
ncbi:hypothetical protein Cgig2_018492 [Carnegiea gigantea]|uniref:Reverse transcriptase n=1 Tax=Carnegiea gigantea TaxID=171969 RepID=A0A9Q1GQH9_9CARY|nr:hypothetical protein Cgig2_018492 [Carnegiea gigantea]